MIQDMVLNYRDVGSGPVVVCLHGWASSLAMWQRTMSHLRRTYRVVALDLPGFGDSECPPAGFDFTPRAYAQVINEWLLQVVPYPAPATVIGHSMGGLIAAQLALDYPDAVGGLILADPVITGNLGAGMGRLLRTRVGQHMLGQTGQVAWIKKASANGWLGDPRFASDLTTQRSLRDMARAAPEAVAGCLRAITTTDLSARLPEIRVPTLIIVGAHDVTIPVRDARMAARQMSDAHLAVVPRASHLPMDQQPELFDRLVTSYLHRYAPVTTTAGTGPYQSYPPAAAGLSKSHYA